MKSIITSLFATLIFSLAGAPSAQAWGERGHHLICQVATRLTKESSLHSFLETRGDIMGHLCNIPDIYWRNIKDPIAGTGDEAHFIDPENGGLTADRVPTKLSDYFGSLKTGDASEKKADILGTLWWRAEQLFNLGIRAGLSAYNSALPANSQEAQQDDFSYNKGILEFITNLGLMGHFVGDASMPLHNTANYDGWGNGHGGIHVFYETNCVSHFGLSLIEQVEKSAKHLRSEMGLHYDADVSVLDRMKEVSLKSFSEKSEMENLDHILAPSQLIKNPDGSTTKLAAKRAALDSACPVFKKMIVRQMARSAVALSALWDQAYRAADRPQLQVYRSYRYPLMPDFVQVDYLPH